MAKSLRRPVATRPAAAGAEIEIKLLGDEAALAAVAASPLVARHARGPGRTVGLAATYYDTPALALSALGAVLRVRREDGRFRMTVKSAAPANGSMLERLERTVAVADAAPDRAALVGMLPQGAVEAVGDSPLQPVFSTEVSRELRLLDTPGGTVELAIDRGRIVAGARTAPVGEIELELVEGSAEALFALADELVAAFPLRPCIYSKAARGFDLLLGRPPRFMKAPPVRFAADATLDEALAAILRAALGHLMHNHPAAEEGSQPEGLHQYRVALRRLRAALALVRTLAPSPRLEAFRADAAWLMTRLGAARDWDVLATATLPEVARNCPSAGGFESLAEVADRHRRAAHEEARAALLDPRTARLQVGLGLWIERRGWREEASPVTLARLAAPARAFAAEALRHLHRRALKRGRRFRALGAEERHLLRIALKKLRYAADFLLPLYPQGKARPRYDRALAELQERFGRGNDAAVAARLLGALAAAPMPAEAHRAAGAVLGWHAARAGGDEAALTAAWKEFRRTIPPWG